jgi:hypothetical protein
MTGIITCPLTGGGAGRTLEITSAHGGAERKEERMARTLGLRTLAWLSLLGAMAVVAHTVQTTLTL